MDEEGEEDQATFAQPMLVQDHLGSRSDRSQDQIGLNQPLCRVYLDASFRMLDIGRRSREGDISLEASI
eukprot:318003-Pyramimonas_sp.AAC.1